VDFTHFLFATGDCRVWIVTTRLAVQGFFGTRKNVRSIVESATSTVESAYTSSTERSNYTAEWVREESDTTTPHISVTSDRTLEGDLLYAGGSWEDVYSVVSLYGGANVFIKTDASRPEVQWRSTCPHSIGPGTTSWTWVRHTAVKSEWHLATDQLLGRDVYGSQGTAGTLNWRAWSESFENTDFTHFLFMSGDCTKWLVARRDIVQGFYSVDIATVDGAQVYVNGQDREVHSSSSPSDAANWSCASNATVTGPCVSGTACPITGTSLEHCKTLCQNSGAYHWDFNAYSNGANVYIYDNGGAVPHVDLPRQYELESGSA
jgi:hypothetical protein